LARVRSRHLEHESVQFKANQAVKESEIERMAELAEKDPETFKEMCQKRSLKFKDPSRAYSETFPLHELPKKAV